MMIQTLRDPSVSVSRSGCTHLLGTAEATAVEEDRKVDDVAHIVMAVDVGVTQHAV